MPAFDLDRIGAELPATTLITQLQQTASAGHAVIEAPPGSGKTTVVPPALANVLPGRILVAQPRRVAARAAARRLAELTGTRVGDLVGFSVRGESRVSGSTRVEFVTAGLLVRRLLTAPDLDGVSAVVLDEVHERSLDADLAFALVTEVAELRDDLTVVAMSATLDTARWSQLLGEAPVLSVPMVPHPLTEHWVPLRGERLDDRGVTRELLQHATAVTIRALAEHPEHSALVFMPGAREVDAVVGQLRDAGVRALPLTGSVSSAEQDAALRPDPDGLQRVVVATSIAESSLTVPDVRLVVDSCLAREPRLDLERGLSGLVTVSVSLAGGRQRAGRAARLGPGAVYRCVSEAQWATFVAQPRPEMLTAELTELALTLAVWGDPFGTELALPDPPPVEPLTAAHELLAAIGAIKIDRATGTVSTTARGEQLSQVPAHPRLARALLDAVPAMGAKRASECVAVLQSDARSPGGDLAALQRQLRDGRGPAQQRWRQDTDRFARILAQIRFPESAEWDAPLTGGAALGLVAALAYPERIARARGRDGSYLLAGGTGAQLGRDSVLSGSEWLAVADVARAHASDGSGARIRSAVAISPELAQVAAPALCTTSVETSFADGRVVAREVQRLGAIQLRATPVPPSPAQATAAVTAEIEKRGLSVLHFSDAATQLRNRLGYLHRHLGAPWPDVSDAALLEDLGWLAPELQQAGAGTPLERLDLYPALQRLLPWPAAARLDELAPERIEVPSGSRIRVDYPDPNDADAPAVLAVKLQECFGWSRTPRLVDGRAALLLHLLSPARRPVAITEDLESFWDNGYTHARAELRGRYPKHPWPEDPRTAPPQRGTKRSGR